MNFQYGINVFPDRPWYVRKRAPILSPRRYMQFKRAMDIAISLAALPPTLIVLALCAVAIRLDSPGPIFFFQMRTGRGGRRFRMHKLRTMLKDAEELKARYMHLNELAYPDFKITNDPRVTRVGRFLRRASLDELPQIFNVLLGDMSLVGPRPTSFSTDRYSVWHTARLDATPGITGLWQISGRSDIEFDERLRLDIAYLQNQSLWLDFQILLRTAGAVFAGKGAC